MAISTVALSSVSTGTLGAADAQDRGAQRNPLASLRDDQASAVAQFSLFGRVQLSLENLQAKAQALQNLNNPPTLNDFKLAVQAVVQAFNALNKTVSEAAAKRAAAAEDARSSQAVSELRKAIAGPDEDGFDRLEKIGIAREQDKSLTVDPSRLENAFSSDRENTLSTLDSIFSRVENTTNIQITNNDNNGSKINNLSNREAQAESELRSEQARLDAQESAQQRLAADLANAGSYKSRNAVATYFNVASL